MPKIKLDKELYERAKEAASASGYASVEEFVGHLLEQALSRPDDDADPDLLDRLKGLGYIA